MKIERTIYTMKKIEICRMRYKFMFMRYNNHSFNNITQ